MQPCKRDPDSFVCLKSAQLPQDGSLLSSNLQNHPIHTASKGISVKRERARAGFCPLPCDLFLKHNQYLSRQWHRKGSHALSVLQGKCKYCHCGENLVEADTSPGRLLSPVKCQLKNKKQNSQTKSLCILSSETQTCNTYKLQWHHYKTMASNSNIQGFMNTVYNVYNTLLQLLMTHITRRENRFLIMHLGCRKILVKSVLFTWISKVSASEIINLNNA